MADWGFYYEGMTVWWVRHVSNHWFQVLTVEVEDCFDNIHYSYAPLRERVTCIVAVFFRKYVCPSDQISSMPSFGVIALKFMFTL